MQTWYIWMHIYVSCIAFPSIFLSAYQCLTLQTCEIAAYLKGRKLHFAPCISGLREPLISWLVSVNPRSLNFVSDWPEISVWHDRIWYSCPSVEQIQALGTAKIETLRPYLTAFGSRKQSSSCQAGNGSNWGAWLKLWGSIEKIMKV